MNFRDFKNSSGKFRLANAEDLVNTIDGVTYEDIEYLEPMITAAEYVDDMYVEEYPTAVVEVDNSAGPWVYYSEQKLPNIDIKKKTHKEFGFVGKLPGIIRRKK